MPTLIQNYQKKQTVTQLKKAYSELSQAVLAAQKDYGTLESWDFTNFETSQERGNYFLENYLKPNLKILKSCTPSNEECWSGKVKTPGGTEYPSTPNERAGRNSLITSSGYSVYYWLHGGVNLYAGQGGWLYVDINGKKQPNTLGKDIFVFVMNWGNSPKIGGEKLGIHPYGLNNVNVPTREEMIAGNFEDETSTVSGDCTKDSTNANSGMTCAALIMTDGWEIAPDYPW